MVDIVSRSKRSRMMSGIRGKNTKPEKLVRSFLHRAGLRFRIHVATLPGKPDLVLRKHRTAILINGCFWHRHRGCRYAYVPKSRISFWNRKFSETKKRDLRNEARLQQEGWRVIVVWECEIDQRRLSRLERTIRATRPKQ